MDFDSLSDALKFSADRRTVDALLKGLTFPDWLGRKHHAHADHNSRLVAADALQEVGRDEDAHLLRTDTPLRHDEYTGAIHPDFPPYAWPGGTPIVYATKDGSALCHRCANREASRWAEDQKDSDEVGWMAGHPDSLTAHGHEEGPPIHCDGCNAEIESAYGDPEQGD